MIKIALRSPAALRSWSRLPILGKHFTLAIDRLDQIDDETEFTSAIRDLRLSNGVTKTTKGNRFQALDQTLLSYLDPGKSYSVHDVAVSDGITSVNLAETLAAHGIRYRMLASDKFAFVYSIRRGLVHYICDGDGNIILAEVFGIVCNRALSRRFWLSRIGGHWLGGKCTVSAERRRIALLNPSTRSAIDRMNIRFCEFDVLAPEPPLEKFDLVRCMNMLNPKVFSDENLRVGMRNLLASLNPGGLLLIGRTNVQSGENDATLYRNVAGKIVKVADFGQGSEVQSLVADASRELDEPGRLQRDKD